jgi:hypothetical protein
VVICHPVITEGSIPFLANHRYKGRQGEGGSVCLLGKVTSFQEVPEGDRTLSLCCVQVAHGPLSCCSSTPKKVLQARTKPGHSQRQPGPTSDVRRAFEAKADISLNRLRTRAARATAKLPWTNAEQQGQVLTHCPPPSTPQIPGSCHHKSSPESTLTDRPTVDRSTLESQL